MDSKCIGQDYASFPSMLQNTQTDASIALHQCFATEIQGQVSPLPPTLNLEVTILLRLLTMTQTGYIFMPNTTITASFRTDIKSSMYSKSRQHNQVCQRVLMNFGKTHEGFTCNMALES